MARINLADALEAWWGEGAVERVARWRGAADARSPEAVLERHAALASERALETLQETIATGHLEDDEAEAARFWVARARAAPHELLARRRFEDALARRLPHDSDHFPAREIIRRIAVEPKPRERRALARTLAEFAAGAWAEAGRAAREHRAEGAEFASAAGAAPPPRPDAARAATYLEQTDDAFAELIARLAHRAKRASPPSEWQELAHLLRAATPDGAVPARGRWRRLGEPLHELGLRELLAQHVRVEPASDRAFGHAIAVVRVPRQVHVRGGAEAGLAGELDAARGLGRALTVAMTHPALPAWHARPRRGAIGHAVGALLAGLLERRRYLERVRGFAEKDARAIAEHALALRLARGRSLCAAALPGEPVERIGRALRVEAHEAIAAAWLTPPDAARLDAALRVGSIAGALRERFDEDWWRNPRTATALRGAAGRGERLSVEAWAAELEAEPVPEGALVLERLEGR